MRLGRVFCLLILFGVSAIAANAQTPIDPFAGDAHVILNVDPPCSLEAYCVELTYTGTGTETFTLSSPTPLPEPPPDTCASADFTCVPLTAPCPPPHSATTCFYGYTFYDFMGTDGEVMNGTDFILGSNEPIALSLTGTGLGCDPSSPNCKDDGTEVSFTPEPGSALLYMSGLVLLVGFAKKRFGTNSLT